MRNKIALAIALLVLFAIYPRPVQSSHTTTVHDYDRYVYDHLRETGMDHDAALKEAIYIHAN